MTQDDAWASMVTVGRIVRPHGNRGHVVVASETDYPDDRFRTGGVLFACIDGRPVARRIVACREHDGRWVMGFEGTGSIDDAEALRGLELRIPASDVRALEPGKYYVHELVGCRVETVDGSVVGSVARVDAGAGAAVLVVDREGAEVLVPLADEICRVVDVGNRRIVIAPPEGLLDLNERQSPAAGRTKP